MKVTTSTKGLKEAQVSLEKFEERVRSEINRRFKAIGMEVLREAKINLRKNDTNTFHNLERSGIVADINGGVKVGFYAHYAAIVEHGRRAGRRPPMLPILDWVHKRGLIEGRRKASRERSAAFLIARAIGRRGTRPQPYFYPAVDKYKPKLKSVMADALETAINETMR